MAARSSAFGVALSAAALDPDLDHASGTSPRCAPWLREAFVCGLSRDSEPAGNLFPSGTCGSRLGDSGFGNVCRESLHDGNVIEQVERIESGAAAAQRCTQCAEELAFTVCRHCPNDSCRCQPIVDIVSGVNLRLTG